MQYKHTLQRTATRNASGSCTTLYQWSITRFPGSSLCFISYIRVIFLISFSFYGYPLYWKPLWSYIKQSVWFKEGSTVYLVTVHPFASRISNNTITISAMEWQPCSVDRVKYIKRFSYYISNHFILYTTVLPEKFIVSLDWFVILQ